MSRIEQLPRAASATAPISKMTRTTVVLPAARWALPLGAAAAAVVLFAPEMAGWWQEWRKPLGYYTHGPVVPVLAAVLIWIDWDRLRRIAPRPSLVGLALVVPALFLLTLSRWSHVFFLSGFAWLMLLPGAICMLYGAQLARALLAPVALMFFQIPMPAEVIEPVSLPIQEISIAWATRYLTWAQLPAVRDNNLIRLPHYIMDIGIQCSGYKLLVALLMLGSFLALAHRGAAWKKVLLVLFCIPLAAVVNAARIALAGILGELVSPRSAGFFHDHAGIFVWIVSFIGFYLAMAALRCNQLKGTESS